MNAISKLCTIGTALLSFGVTNSVKATYIVDAVESGGNVVLTGRAGGSLNLSAWSNPINTTTRGQMGVLGGVLGVGASQTNFYQTGFNFMAADPFRSGTAPVVTASPNSPDNTGPYIGVANGAGGQLLVPINYVSGAILPSSSSTYFGQTFASLGMTPGTYEWSWGSNDDESSSADSYILNIIETTTNSVPDGGSTLLLLGIAMLVGFTFQRFSPSQESAT